MITINFEDRQRRHNIYNRHLWAWMGWEKYSEGDRRIEQTIKTVIYANFPEINFLKDLKLYI